MTSADKVSRVRSQKSRHSFIARPRSFFGGAASFGLLTSWPGMNLNWSGFVSTDDIMDRIPLPISMTDSQSIYTYLTSAISDDAEEVISKAAYSVIHKHCQHMKAFKDLSSHYPDMHQEILTLWLMTELEEGSEESYALPQVIAYAQNKARYCIQSYLERNEHALTIPRAESRSNAVSMGGDDFDFVEFADLGWGQDVPEYTNELSSISGWKSVYYSQMELREQWVVFFLIMGLSAPQITKLLNISKRTVYRILERIKKDANTMDRPDDGSILIDQLPI